MPRCLIGAEACATHYWARELTGLGHDVRLIPAAYAKACVRRNKNDAADAAASASRGPSTHAGTDTRCIATNLLGGRAKHLYEGLYCALGARCATPVTAERIRRAMC